MKKIKKIVALLLTFSMVLGMMGNMSFVNAEALDWFESATEFSLTAEDIAVTAETSNYYKYTPTEDGFFNFTDYKYAYTETTCYLRVAVYDAQGEAVVEEISTTGFDPVILKANETYYIELYSAYRDWSTWSWVRVADTVGWTATFSPVNEITSLENVSVTLATGQAEYYAYTPTEDGFVDFMTCSTTTTSKGYVTVYDAECNYIRAGYIDKVNAIFVEGGETYYFVVEAYNNEEETTLVWDADYIIPTELEDEDLATVLSEIEDGGSCFYKYESTKRGYFEITEADSSGYARFMVYDVNGGNLESGAVENVDKIALKVGDVIYIEIYAQTGYDYSSYTAIKGEADITWKATAYTCGTEEEPEEIGDTQSFALALDAQGHYFTYTATEVGELGFYISSYDTADFEIVVTHENVEYKLSESTKQTAVAGYWGDDYYDAVVFNVEEGDEFEIHVYATGETINNVRFGINMVPPLGTIGNPESMDYWGEITELTFDVAAGESYYFEIDYGMEATIIGTGDFIVTEYDADYEEDGDYYEAVNGKVTVYGYTTYYVTNESDATVTYTVTEAYPLGSTYNPLILDNYNVLSLEFEAYAQSYYYMSYATEEAVTLYLELPEAVEGSTAGWELRGYTMTAEGSYDYSRMINFHTFDGNTEGYTIELAAGESVDLMICPGEYNGSYYDYNTTAVTLDIVIATVTENPFEDVQEADYFATPVMWAYANGVTTGKSEGTFAPTGQCTRAEIVTFLWRAAGSPEPTITENPFTDVAEDAYYTKAVLWAYENEITTGKGNGRFATFDVCTRAEVVTFLWRAMGKPAPSITTHTFADVAANDYYTTAVLWAFENGITTGKDATTFGTNSKCIRADVVTFLYRTFK